VGLERGPFIRVRIIEEALEIQISSFGIENRKIRPYEYVVLTMQQPLTAKLARNLPAAAVFGRYN
jgi:hypothetical protein